MSDRLAALRAALAALVPDWGLVGDVVDLQRLSGGASRETFTFALRSVVGDEEGFVLQRARAGAVASGPGMAGEARLVHLAARSGVPVPEVVADGPDDGIGAPWIVTRRLEGETIPRRLLRDDAYAEARGRLVAECGEALAAIHRVPVSETRGLGRGDQLELLRGLADGLGSAHPAFELGFRWLEANRPAPSSTAPTVVHGDFRLGNLLVDPTGLRAVLDWELAHVGDPMEDLGWLCVRAWRFGEQAPVAGLGSLEELAAAYEGAGGARADPAALHWWQVLGTLKWGLICILQVGAHLRGEARSVELAAIGRRVCETEHDLLLALPGPAEQPAPTPRAEAGGASGAPHDRPTAMELTDAVREHLEREVMEATEGRVRFHARVAANVLGMVARQIELGPSQEAAHAERLRALGFASDEELAGAIRRGDLDDHAAEVKQAVWASVVDKVAVANPGYR